MNICIPASEALVMVCGPSCTGKSTLARKVYELAPMRPHEKTIHSNDAVMLRLMRREPQLKRQLEMIEQYGVIERELMPDGLFAKLHQQNREQLVNRVRKHKFVVPEGGYCTYDQVAALLMGLGLACDDRPFVLIKMAPDINLHRKLYQTSQSKHHQLFEAARMEADEFETVVQTQFADTIPMLTEYVVTDPTDVQLSFE